MPTIYIVVHAFGWPTYLYIFALGIAIPHKWSNGNELSPKVFCQKSIFSIFLPPSWNPLEYVCVYLLYGWGSVRRSVACVLRRPIFSRKKKKKRKGCIISHFMYFISVAPQFCLGVFSFSFFFLLDASLTGARSFGKVMVDYRIEIKTVFVNCKQSALQSRKGHQTYQEKLWHSHAGLPLLSSIYVVSSLKVSQETTLLGLSGILGFNHDEKNFSLVIHRWREGGRNIVCIGLSWASLPW